MYFILTAPFYWKKGTLSKCLPNDVYLKGGMGMDTGKDTEDNIVLYCLSVLREFLSVNPDNGWFLLHKPSGTPPMFPFTFMN